MSTSTTPYTFHWICPRPTCHTCLPRPQHTQPLKPSYFDDYEESEEYELELEREEIGTPLLMQLPTALLIKEF
jgi:hypothetical protein